ncbi:uncharacterized protein LOC128676805 [Plodia interpunctella]|uniref:uncharacterized protein LOC128676805 n=1 Tax=Plodia interpunctella TaxID=58824 RepID=UPI002367F48B|nr:uncharacterized protein LOC128676805 [Plodia interpunctella]
MNEEELANCQFVPFSTMEKVMTILDKPYKEQDYRFCKRDLYKVQSEKVNPGMGKGTSELKCRYQLALSRAIYSHDWDKLLYLLKKSPIFHHFSHTSRYVLDRLNVYIRAMIILFMFHPEAKSKQLLHEYLHMVCTCRTEQEKRALMRVILTLPEKLHFMRAPPLRKLNNDYD